MKVSTRTWKDDFRDEWGGMSDQEKDKFHVGMEEIFKKVNLKDIEPTTCGYPEDQLDDLKLWVVLMEDQGQNETDPHVHELMDWACAYVAYVQI